MTLTEQILLTESFIQLVKGLCVEGMDVDGNEALHLDVKDAVDVRWRLMRWIEQEGLHTCPSIIVIEAPREDKAVP